MSENGNRPSGVERRSDRGLAVAGTRITLYDIWDYVRWGWSPERIRDILRITDRQYADAMRYIEEHREAFEAEYQAVVADAEELRRSTEERNRERFAHIAAMPPRTDHPEARAKLAALKAELGQS